MIVLPADISAAEITDISHLNPTYSKPPVVTSQIEDLNEIARLLNESKKITIYAGYGAKDARNEVISLAKKLKAPIAHTSRAKMYIEWDNPYNVGMTGTLGLYSGYKAIKSCEIMLILGADFAWSSFYPEHANIIQIDINSSKLGLRHSIKKGVIGDVKYTVAELLKLVTEKEDSKFLNEMTTLHDKSVSEFNKKAISKDADLIHPQYLVSLLSKHAQDDAIFTGDSGSPFAWALHGIKSNGRREFLSSLKTWNGGKCHTTGTGAESWIS